MCGIAGIFTTQSAFDLHNLCNTMASALTHRGPDFQAVHKLDDLCVFGHSRLKIIDLNDAANQPMYCYQKRFVIIFNGEIYNYQTLRLELQRVEYKSSNKPYPFQTKSDTEVILAAYHRWGKECVKYLDGMFAFAIYDTLKKELFIARDRQGKKPIYYIYKDNTFAFTSEIRPLINLPFCNKTLNTQQLFDYFQYQTSFSPFTLIKDIQLLEAAHTLTISLSSTNTLAFEKKRYWNYIDHLLNEDDISYEDAKKKVRELLFAAVEKRLISDVPLGAFLSGGIDSSAIVGIMKRYLSTNVNTFHITTNVQELSEKEYASSLSSIYQTNHHTILLKENEVLQLVPEALEKMDYPSGDGINTYIVSKATKQQGITVALSGIGGDELFAGYPQFKVINKLHHLHLVDFPYIRQLLASFIPPSFSRTSYRLKILLQSKSLKAPQLFPLYRQIFSQSNLPLVNTNTSSFFHYNTNYQSLIQQKHLISFVSILEMDNYMQHVLLRDTDQMSMANALEVRSPFLDTALVSFVLSLPDNYKYPHTPKRLLTEALKDILPNDIIHRKKMGFVLPFKNWMRKELNSFCNQKIKDLSKYPFINPKILNAEWNHFQSQKHDRWWEFWHLIVLQHWIEKENIKVE